MRINIAKIFIFIFFMFNFVFTAHAGRDPFMSVIPQPEKKEDDPQDPYARAFRGDMGARSDHRQRVEGDFNGLSLQGVLWGLDVPQVIINDEIYKEKDIINGREVRILKIEKNTVTLLSRGEIRKMSPEAASTGQR